LEIHHVSGGSTFAVPAPTKALSINIISAFTENADTPGLPPVGMVTAPARISQSLDAPWLDQRNEP
jgi:hypothetical protein